VRLAFQHRRQVFRHDRSPSVGVATRHGAPGCIWRSAARFAILARAPSATTAGADRWG
jgi:hypothetical protein